MVVVKAISLIFKDLTTPSDFQSDWYGWVTNQMAHITLGIMFTAVLSSLCYLLLGEFAHKAILWGLIAAIFAFNEIVVQHSKKLWDSLEDFVFITIYGAGTSIIMFDEVAPGSPDMVTSITSIAPICVVVASHLVAGSISRAIEEVKRNGA